MQTFDVTARKAHQWTMVGLIAIGFVLGEPRGAWLLALAGAIMLLGRFWWPADLVRQFVWRVVEPAGWLPRVEREEDHAPRRVARVLGGSVWLHSAILNVGGFSSVARLLWAAIAIKVAVDGSVDFRARYFIGGGVGR